jgi:hypothetical protein
LITGHAALQEISPDDAVAFDRNWRRLRIALVLRADLKNAIIRAGAEFIERIPE